MSFYPKTSSISGGLKSSFIFSPFSDLGSKDVYYGFGLDIGTTIPLWKFDGKGVFTDDDYTGDEVFPANYGGDFYLRLSFDIGGPNN